MNATNKTLTIVQDYETSYVFGFRRDRSPEVSPFVFLPQKFVFCGIAKNAISMWKMVFLRMLGKPWWLPAQKDVHAWETGINNYRMWSRSSSEMSKILHDKNFHKAVFIRDPLERALSALLDKVEKEPYFVCLSSPPPFFFFLIFSSYKKQKNDRPQHMYCDLYKYRDLYTVYDFRNKSHRKLFLEKVQLYESVGKDKWHSDDHDPNVTDKKNTVGHSIMSFDVVEKRHAKQAGNKVTQHFTMQLVAHLLDFYRMDYILFDLPLPQWICDLFDSNFVSQKLQKNKPWQQLKKEEKHGVSVHYHFLVQMYSTIRTFPSHLQPSCMGALQQCISNGICVPTNINGTATKRGSTVLGGGKL
ncbi:hypothetical protein RFI_12672 [Reticulomyxa filosa]|uniref:Carbohydrate sulfotransferase n=1 Tax=Reticulomyxa filosa TaxID=46433 RepID=X6NDT8_RETFI|nr:hypothetical protein RFI_12672 [Reticulomyxa filosa]|eukprot:ETO24485.1 hypothetical protein RFI_12672 [Reticulomyxa filosa]